jgi:hypothetical protein
MKDGLCLAFIDDELPVPDIVAERRQAAHPHALLLRRSDFVADPFAGHLPLKLGKGTGSPLVPQGVAVCGTDRSSSVHEDRHLQRK